MLQMSINLGIYFVLCMSKHKKPNFKPILKFEVANSIHINFKFLSIL